ncbi:hypothetical protein CLAFUW4_13077 [Fulvia fulva]|uniref:Uncharacterized protein n=1 Tax=Passalora fulva TaxID=5499 RepID=A0A9Q8UVB8_PASFU|nr:uncharacterized protein CLAFUR5_12935 [Fulvia fulva]KAK4612194.1 hypothetical protein CLAFUR4_13081 [Fulvia fulva]KAK4612731.1 hypothetical protein CLAFUR0_13085 [Fulvia fulva]UJO23801.1 hypothetical protein CLAFUR5_12935 [Fulvia fulva]WPV21433.1 hypothetical protein CLAFUW4_13077 [Fulvia fulva]WPV36500.1 hypothetical protein CLAFUW7_13084 [Fulvia fulva]
MYEHSAKSERPQNRTEYLLLKITLIETSPITSLSICNAVEKQKVFELAKT